MELAVVLRQLREAQRLSKLELAEKAGVHASVVGRVESGQTLTLSVANLEKLAKALDVDEATLRPPGTDRTGSRRRARGKLTLGLPASMFSVPLVLASVSGSFGVTFESGGNEEELFQKLVQGHIDVALISRARKFADDRCLSAGSFIYNCQPADVVIAEPRSAGAPVAWSVIRHVDLLPDRTELYWAHVQDTAQHVFQPVFKSEMPESDVVKFARSYQWSAEVKRLAFKGPTRGKWQDILKGETVFWPENPSFWQFDLATCDTGLLDDIWSIVPDVNRGVAQVKMAMQMPDHALKSSAQFTGTLLSQQFGESSPEHARILQCQYEEFVKSLGPDCGFYLASWWADRERRR